MDSIDSAFRRLAAGVAALAGFVDAYGFLATKGYFVSFMSGNTTRLAVGIASWSAHAAVPALIIAGFVAGVMGGEWMGLRFASFRARNVLLFSAVWLAVAALTATYSSALGGAAGAVAMGATNTVFSRERRLPVGLTYMTGTLVLIGHAIVAWLMRGTRQSVHLLFAHWLALIAGGVAGATAFQNYAYGAAWFAAAGAVVLAVLAQKFLRAPGTESADVPASR
jgi:uncharacterized membrane protein YoaK (UPF0700 family)